MKLYTPLQISYSCLSISHYMEEEHQQTYTQFLQWMRRSPHSYLQFQIDSLNRAISTIFDNYPDQSSLSHSDLITLIKQLTDNSRNNKLILAYKLKTHFAKHPTLRALLENTDNQQQIITFTLLLLDFISSREEKAVLMIPPLFRYELSIVSRWMVKEIEAKIKTIIKSDLNFGTILAPRLPLSCLFRQATSVTLQTDTPPNSPTFQPAAF